MLHPLTIIYQTLNNILELLKGIFLFKKNVTQIEDKHVDILHQNENYLIINKPYDLLINSEEIGIKDTLHIRLEKQFPSLVCPEVKFSFYFPHRLDYSTSGLMVIALNKTACHLMSSCLEKKKVQKYYLALVRGIVSQDVIDIHHPIGYNQTELNQSNAMCSPEYNPNCIHAKSAHTRLIRLSYGLYNSFPCTKVLIRIITGRRHQIRVHCCNLGHTIVGDYTYSRRKDRDPPRQMLHAYRMRVDKMPNFDFRTRDPFSEKFVPGWRELRIINKLNDESVFSKLEKL